MATVLSLMIITLCASLVRRDERLPALVYCTLSYIFYFISVNIDCTGTILIASAFSELCLIALLVSINGCLKSVLIKYLIPLSIAMGFIHWYGWVLYINEYSLEPYNQYVMYYWGIIAALFLSQGDWRGSRGWINNIFNNTDTKREDVGVVFKEAGNYKK